MRMPQRPVTIEPVVSLPLARRTSCRPTWLSERLSANLARPAMSHHFDTPTAQEDPRVNMCDFYLFAGRPGTTVMAMTVNPDAGISAPDTFRDEGLYAFRFDLNNDVREELTFKFRFGDPRHADGIDRHVQDCQVRMASGEDALHGLGGELLVEG